MRWLRKEKSVDRQFHGKDAAAAVEALQLAAHADRPGRRSRPIGRKVAIVRTPIRFGHQHLDIAPDHIADFIAKHLDRRRIDRSDDAGVIDGDDAVQNVVQNRLEPGLGILEIVLDLYPFGHVRRELDHLRRNPVRPQDGVVTGFYPDCIALLIDYEEIAQPGNVRLAVPSRILRTPRFAWTPR